MHYFWFVVVNPLIISLNAAHAYETDDVVEILVDESEVVSERAKFLSNSTFQPIIINHWDSTTTCVYMLSIQ